MNRPLSKQSSIGITKVLWALVASLVLSSCGGDGDSQDDLNPNNTSVSPSALFDPVAASAIVPFPIDLFFVDATSPSGFSTDTTLNIPNSSSSPFVDQANLQDGFSTVAEAFLDILGLNIDLDTANNPAPVPADRGIVVVNTTNGSLLNPGVDYQVTRSALIPSRTRLYIQWLKPLAPRSTYAVIVTRQLATTDGVAVEPSIIFRAVRSPDAIGSASNPVPPTAPALTQDQIAQLEQIRQFVQPLFQFAEADLPGGLGIARDQIALAWPFTTQSTTDSLAAVNATAAPQAMGVSPAPGPGGTLSTGELGLGLPDTADIYVGTIALPYYLDAAANAQDPSPLISFWESDGTAAAGNSTLPSTPPCGAFAPSVSTTACFPTPVEQSTQTVPVIVTVPNGNSTCPALPPPGGYPVTIFIHGITRNRGDVLAVAPALANACQVVVAIDLPLHGITPTSPLASFRLPEVVATERTFDVDYAPTQDDGAGNCSQSTANPAAPAPDGVVDCSGGHFINLGSLITSRDNIRQGVIDNIHVLKTVQASDIVIVDGMGMPVGSIDTNTDVTHFLGHSLGGIVATTLMGINDEGTAASLAMTGGGIAKLLDGSPTFGPVIAAGLAGNGVNEGTDTYETFLRFAQTLVDSADSINHAATAGSNYPIHFMEVVGEEGESLPDQVIPNSVPADPPNVFTSGPLGGTDPLVAELGLMPIEDVNPETMTPACLAGPDTVVKFLRGDHGSILDPSASLATTVEMQTQVASFL
ncbi:MAG: hypothetical protein R3352_06475, partial [Salinisphaeraceae bacterium]|nr:hypothetical protein [Salinisphaeraceae bacterium]